MIAYMIYRKGYGWVERDTDDYSKMSEGALFSTRQQASTYVQEEKEVVVKVNVTRAIK